ncbi:MAG: IS200/IS605 family element transposase accessory protein TnpB [Okeania sp. SIO2G4]|uniref:RNA-guided endonuclease InsQ/TnpB family protein n=1 Tax=unclassified Okeania TaxID=2634635 RepID=UPI0013BDBC48|nr:MULTISPECIES: RNA-guided endonuclease TnpB family protein [unclassified Okeania]NEP04960.1 IS200/IS605 family element transposase accessory protein TnpB [Okeania sp. SIO4D6]NEP45438.1 IS200/IS605 family element transposase accessory protein TnpB [Okeania sp. SIO2H7]NEP75346.1 IS200/IS605 family element transposase accessory protein TnpB [Okeania sp. SIO2G5]NEP95450.1 IS200/IS605 family element transposase accessory protein TnpB [Okeania sp. SIO2F5]NEQ93164.1 IS200/IS605 family element trans
MLLGFKTELHPNNHQKTLLAKHAGVARHAYNWGLWLTKNILNHNQHNPDSKLKFPTAIDLHKLLVAMVKPNNYWYYEVSKTAPQYALRYLSNSWKRCFTKVSGQPKFKKKGKDDSFTLDGSITVGFNQIKLPRIGWVKTYEILPDNVTPKSVTISRKADRWFISFKTDTETQITEKSVDVVGVDLGIKSLATLSTGEVFPGAKSYRKLEAQLSRLQYLNRHKVKFSNNWKKAQLKIAKLHSKIADIRKDTLHKLTTYLAKNHSQIVIEDLNVSGMMANHKLAKAIADMGFYEFRRQLEYKCQLYGSSLTIVDRWFPSSKTCCNCGTVKESLLLSERAFTCEHCNFSCDRDLNAALNLAQAVSLLRNANANDRDSLWTG